MSTIRNLPAVVRERFKAAQASGNLTFFETQVSILNCEGLPFQLRFSPALANKPKANKPSNSKPIDPFENPPTELFVTDLPPSHFIVLNKFPVIPNHFILATKTFKRQTDPLEQDDLAAAYTCVKAYRDNGEELFGFFNSGEASGASQPHRHIQFLPIESMRSGIEEGVEWNVLADSLMNIPEPALPFAFFVRQLPKDATPKDLNDVYIWLHEAAWSIWSEAVAKRSDEKNSSWETQDLPRFSYNLALTSRAMVLCPRISEGLKIKDTKGNLVGPISLNGTILGGTLLVKSEQEWNALRNDEEKLKDILQAIGAPPTKNEKEGKL